MLMQITLVTLYATTTAVAPQTDLSSYMQDAAEQLGVPVAVIRAVVSAESGGDPKIVSPKGAMGAMQLMPATWQYLRTTLALGADPFDPHDNILAGTFYLRALYDTYGWEGFLAAYNAGPSRYENHRNTGKPLPTETQIYVARIVAKLDRKACVFGPNQAKASPALWSEAALFATTTADTYAVKDPFKSVSTPFVVLPLPTEDAPTQ
jgi:soluble lytic murein transglycosylase-like protein